MELQKLLKSWCQLTGLRWLKNFLSTHGPPEVEDVDKDREINYDHTLTFDVLLYRIFLLMAALAFASFHLGFITFQIEMLFHPLLVIFLQYLFGSGDSSSGGWWIKVPL